MPPYANDDELFTLLKTKLFPAVVGDVLDKMGYLHQFLPADIEPLESFSNKHRRRCGPVSPLIGPTRGDNRKAAAPPHLLWPRGLGRPLRRLR